VLDIPTHNRVLVERSCGRSALQALADELGGPWPEHAVDLHGKHSAQRAAALFACIDWQKPWREAVPGELNAEAKTRLGLDGIDLVLPQAQVSPFGHSIEKLTVPAWMLPALPAGESSAPPPVEDAQAVTGGFRFSVGGRTFLYDRHGLAQATSPHQ
jgi:hypothetical protein